MPDDKTKIGGRDRKEIDNDEDYEIRYMKEKTGAFREEILQAIKKVGNDRAKVEEYLKANRQ